MAIRLTEVFSLNPRHIIWLGHSIPFHKNSIIFRRVIVNSFKLPIDSPVNWIHFINNAVSMIDIMHATKDLLMSNSCEFIKWNVQSLSGTIPIKINNNKVSLAFLSNMNWDDIKVNDILIIVVCNEPTVGVLDSSSLLSNLYKEISEARSSSWTASLLWHLRLGSSKSEGYWSSSKLTYNNYMCIEYLTSLTSMSLIWFT